MNRLSLFSVALLVVLLDQGSKFLILSWLSYGDVVPVIPNFFNLVLTYNKGVAFGVFSGIHDDTARYLVLGLTTAIALGALYFFARSEGFEGKLPQTAFAMIIGGAIGNLIDRVRQGMVTDFLDFYIGESHWPAFNIADSAIFLAVCILLFLTPSKKTPEA